MLMHMRLRRERTQAAPAAATVDDGGDSSPSTVGAQVRATRRTMESVPAHSTVLGISGGAILFPGLDDISRSLVKTSVIALRARTGAGLRL